MNRGVARRTLFEDRGDIDHFLDLVAEQVDAGRIVVHSYVVLTTHFHMLVSSPKGELAVAMKEIESPYARRFNERRGLENRCPLSSSNRGGAACERRIRRRKNLTR